MQRFSKKRQAILDCLCNTSMHPTAEWIYQQLRTSLPGLSLATVYRNLTQLKEAGLVRSVGIIDGHEHFDGNLSPHAHILCKNCGRIFDVMDDEIMRGLIARAQESSDFLISDVSLRFTGLCPECRKAENQ